MNNNNKNPRQLRPWVKWTLGVIMAGAVGLGVYHFSSENASSADLVGGIDNFIGWAPGVAMNEGLDANKESRMYNEFGLALKINVIGEVPQQIAALKSGDVDFIFTTTDISPIMMEEGSEIISHVHAQPTTLLIPSLCFL